MIQPISTSEAPQALGHYSQAIVHNGLVYVSGQLPLDPNNPDAPLGDVASQTLQTLANVEAILKAANSDRSKVLTVTLYITDLALWGKINEAYGQFFGTHKPARAAVPVTGLPKNCLVEIMVTAAI